jgi:hypothetical protein
MITPRIAFELCLVSHMFYLLVTSTNRVSPSGKSHKSNSSKSTHPENLGEIPPVVKKLHPSENAD